MTLDGTTFRVSATADNGVVDSNTLLSFMEKGGRVLGRYSGGAIERGCLVGVREGSRLTFRYAQREGEGQIHGGHSVCTLEHVADGRLLLAEHFIWDTREGSGTNLFEEITESGSR
jgi:hypothetical protein